MPVEELPTVDRVLAIHRAARGADFTAYRGHAYRVANFCGALAPDLLDVQFQTAAALLGGMAGHVSLPHG
jgi:hypothetical protein